MRKFSARIVNKIVLITFIGISLSVVNLEAKNKGIFRDINSSEAYALVYSSVNYILIDVRTEPELLSGMIEDAIHIDYHDKNFKKTIQKLDKKKKYIVYCEVGWRSKRTLKLMKKYKFIEAYNIKDGIVGWNENNFPIIFLKNKDNFHK